MLQVNKLLISKFLCFTFSVLLVVSIIVNFSTCKKHTVNSYPLESDTLFFKGIDKTDEGFMYLLMKYKILDKDSVYVERSDINKVGGVSDFYRYYIVKRNDSLVLIKPVIEKLDSATLAYLNESDSVYIDLQKGKVAHVDYFLHRLNSELQFVGYEPYKDKNGQQDSLIIMYGCDINQGHCFDEYKGYWFFDRNFHLRKVVGEDGNVFLLDKHYFDVDF